VEGPAVLEPPITPSIQVASLPESDRPAQVIQGEIMGLLPGLWPPKVMKNSFCPALLFPEAPPSPLSSRPKRSEVERSLCGCTPLKMSFAGAHRSGEICGSSSRTRGVNDVVNPSTEHHRAVALCQLRFRVGTVRRNAVRSTTSVPPL
jgi:hypothetical protein